MATRRIYYDDAFVREFSASVLTCEPESHAGTHAWCVVLDSTAFYPTSGGQPHDIGKIGSAHVVDVRDAGEEIEHIVDQEVPLQELPCCIDSARRFDHMQQHTGQHLLSAMFHERFGRPTVSFHMGAEISTIDLRGPEPNEDVLEGAERAANAIIFEDRPVTVRYGTAEDLAKHGVRKEVKRAGILRAIEIERADLQPCGGTHVRSTGQIGTLLVRRCSKMKQDWRVEFVCGSRAERAARRDFALLRAAAEKLGCAADDLVAAVERTVTERDGHFKRTRMLLQQLAEAEARQLLEESGATENGSHVVTRVLDGVEPEFLGFFAREIAKREKSVALLAGLETGHMIFAQHPSVGRDMNALFKEVVSKVGGKGGGTRDVARGRLENPASATDALEIARRALVSA